MEYAGKMLLCGVRIYHAILDFVGWFLPNDISYHSSWKICNLENSEYFISDTRENLCFTDEFSLLIHNVRKTKGLQEDFRSALHWSDFHRESYTLDSLFNNPPAPWLFIGFRDGEDIVDCTEMFNKFICFGNEIRIELLNFIVPEGRGKTWVYISPKTFEESIFPSEGMLIEDVRYYNEEEQGDKKND